MAEAESAARVEMRELVTIGAEAFTSPDYARAEPDRLWRKVWQHACREEDVPEVGDYVVYDICDDTRRWTPRNVQKHLRNLVCQTSC